MSKAVKKSVYLLMVLLIAALGFAFMTYMNLEDTKENLSEVEKRFVDSQNEFQTKERKNLAAVKEFENTIDSMTNEKTNLLAKIDEIEEQASQQADFFANEIDTITENRDKWKRRIEVIREERNQLMTKITELNKKLEEKPEPIIVYKEKEGEPEAAEVPVDISKAPSTLPDSGRIVDEQYWANLVKEKASLQIDIGTLKEELSKKLAALVEVKQENEGLLLEISALKSGKEEIEIQAQHTEGMIDNISLELARTKNDKKFIVNRAEQLSEENDELRGKLKKLILVKNAMEKSIVRISQEKDKIENKLGRTETLIQSKIDEIWDIKDELDHSIRSSRVDTSSNEVELPPIVVSSSGGTESFNTGVAAPSFNGQVISINESNNFVIVDIGGKSGVRLGDNLSVYRDSKYIARLEVIQVREDISAADLKDQWSRIKVGDVIR